MDKITKNILNLITNVFLAFFIILTVVNDTPNKLILLVLLGTLSISLIFRRKVLYKKDVNSLMCKVSFLVDSALIYWITLVDRSGASEALFFILIGQVVMIYSEKNGLIFTIINFISYVIISYIKLGYPEVVKFFPKVANCFLNFAFIYGFMYITKHQITQREVLKRTTKELELKTAELEKAYNKLQESYDAVEEVTILKERNRIAGEIHDTVGHTLTTVLVEMEAGKRLMKKDIALAAEKLELAQGQVRKGLNDIRKSVRTLKEGEDTLNFIDSIMVLIHETEKHGGVKIESDISEIPSTSNNIEKSLYRSLQEALTNGIRHGKSSEFKFSLAYSQNKIKFCIKDNGCGCEQVEFGFGLNNMRHRIEQCGGTLEVQSKLNEGCTIFIEIPVEEN